MFKRTFCLTLSVVLTVLVGIFALVLISSVAEESGFSSGELFVFAFKDGVLFGEALGRKVSLSFVPIFNVAQRLQPLAILLPPIVQLVLRYIINPEWF